MISLMKCFLNWHFSNKRKQVLGSSNKESLVSQVGETIQFSTSNKKGEAYTPAYTAFHISSILASVLWHDHSFPFHFCKFQNIKEEVFKESFIISH
jgi:hypothetical protein